MILSEITKFLDALFKKELALDGDNCGLLIGNTKRDIKKILVALDVTDAVIDEAIQKKAGLILVHHPLIFDPLKSITTGEKIQEKILKIIENNIAVYAAHTNYDAMPAGLGQLVADKAGLINTAIIEPSCVTYMKGSITLAAGIGRIGDLTAEKTLHDFLEELKKSLGLECISWLSASPSADLKRKIRRVAVINGGANSCTDYLASTGFTEKSQALDAVIVGELKYSNAIKIAESGIIVIAIGHAESEKFAIDGMFEMLKDFLISNLNNDIEALKSKSGYLPWRYYFE